MTAVAEEFRRGSRGRVERLSDRLAPMQLEGSHCVPADGRWASGACQRDYNKGSPVCSCLRVRTDQSESASMICDSLTHVSSFTVARPS